MKSILDETSADRQEADDLIRLPQGKPKALFRVLSRVAGLLALILIFLGFLFDAADIDRGIEPTTLLLLGLYVLGVQIYFLLEHFVDTGGID
jgi:hypothetical protein